MDRLDQKILSILQKNSRISMARLSEQVGLSLSACHRRVKLLESSGIIEAYTVRLDRASLNLEMQVFIEVKLTSPRREDALAFEDEIARMPEVLECHLISGEFDYLIRLMTKNTAAYEKLYRGRLSQIPSVAQMKTLLSLSTVKEFEGLNLDAATVHAADGHTA